MPKPKCPTAARIGLLALLAACPAASGDVAYGRYDTFSASFTQKWEHNQISGLVHTVETGGPAGDGDGYLQIDTTGEPNNAGSRLGATNEVRWAGDFISQGVTSIHMDVKNFAAEPIDLRLSFHGQFDGSTIAVYTTAESVRVDPDGLWHSVVFDIREQDLVLVASDWTYEEVMSDVLRMQIRHQPGDPAGFPGTAPAFDGSMGLDNIVGLPTPASALVLAPLALLRTRRRR